MGNTAFHCPSVDWATRQGKRRTPKDAASQWQGPAAIGLLLLLAIARPSRAETHYVSVTGADAEDRDGRSWDAAWQSLAYACERVPQDKHTIQLGAGTFVATRAARPKSGVTIIGAGRSGKEATRIVASQDWRMARSRSWQLPRITDSKLAKLIDRPPKVEPEEEYLVVLEAVKDVTIRDLVLGCAPEHRISGGVLCRRSAQIAIHDARVHDFRWAGLTFENCSRVEVHHCVIKNASTEKRRWHNGLIRTRWIKDSELHHNRIVSDEGGGYGYKGGGHRNVRIHHNHINVAGGFAIESAHENEYGVEIDHNYATRCISIPKGGQSADPTKEGYEYSFWIHHNLLTDSYTIEGPRNHLRLSHNYVRIEKTGGNVYTQHGGTNHGPVWIHHNVVENVDRGLIWMNRGLAENIYVYNNTVFCADAGKRAGAVLSSWTAERLNHWVLKNNIIVAPASQPRKLFPDQRGVPGKITATDNVCINVTGVPEGNHVGVDPGFRREGKRPWPYYAPARPDSFAVDRGLDVGLPFEGRAPDIGAYEFGTDEPFPVMLEEHLGQTSNK